MCKLQSTLKVAYTQIDIKVGIFLISVAMHMVLVIDWKARNIGFQELYFIYKA